MPAIDTIVEAVSTRHPLHHTARISPNIFSAAWLASVVNWTSSYSWGDAVDPEEEADEEEIHATLSKIAALYEQAKAGIGSGGKVRMNCRRPVCRAPCSM